MICTRWGLSLLLALICLSPPAARTQTSAGDDPDRLANDGQQALAAGHFAEAGADFEQLAKLHPEVAEVHATLAAIYFKLREYQLSVREVRTAQKIKPGLPRLDTLLGLSLSELGRYQEALPQLEKAFRQSADSQTRRMCGLQLLRAYTGLGRDADAVETALALNRFYPDDPEVLYNTGRIYGNFAYLVMEKLHDNAPNSIWMLQAQGEANESQKDYDAAIIAFNHVLELDPKRPGIHYRLGRVYLARFRDTRKTEDQEAAIREFSAELSVDPQNDNAAYELANLNAENGNNDEAQRQFEALLAHFPDFEEALVGLAGIDLANRQPQAAVPLLQHATRLRPDDEVAWWRLAQADRALGNKEGQAQALAEFQKIHSTIPVTLRSPNAVNEITPQKLDAEAHP
jgi:tetratricopeptide (TPR) repeat protein